MKIITDKFTYGTQYYRPPTPLPEEWETDLRSMAETVGIDTIQFRVQWRWNETREGEYSFADLDRLFELAEKYHKKVLFKFLLENAPDYIYNRYGGTRCDMHGVPMRLLAHGAYYCGGWLPCFDNPEVLRKAGDFVRLMTERYKDRPEILLWNVWNEPSSRPIGECGCSHSVKAYRDWLRECYGSIDRLNGFLGKCWDDFSTVEPPASASDYAELFLWRKWAMYAVRSRVKFVYDIVKGLDPDRPVITHVGGCSILQDAAGGCSDDVQNAAAVDFYGCSLPTASVLDNPISDCWPVLQGDWLRAVSPYFWVYELYPDWGAWLPKVRLGDYQMKVFGPLAAGAKGIVYWQYRAERLGMENNLSGLVNIDGSPKEVSRESLKISKVLHEHQQFLMQAAVKTDPIAIVYSVDSDLINRVENTGANGFWDFSLNATNGLYLYKKALCGIYALFRELGYTVEWLDSRNLPERAKNYRLLYLPEMFMPTDAETVALLDYARNGGKIIAEEGLGLRQPNTWVHTAWPSPSFRELFGVKIAEREQAVFRGDTLTFGNCRLTPEYDNFISRLEVATGDIMAKWADGSPAMLKNGGLVFLGTSLGAIFHDGWQNQYEPCVAFLSRLLTMLGLAVKDPGPRNVYRRDLQTDNATMTFLFNRNDVPAELLLPDLATATPVYGSPDRSGDRLNLPPGSTTILYRNQSKGD